MAFLREARTGATRRPIHRIYVIHEAVNEGSYPNCRTLAERLEVTDKTIQRDITFMRDELGLPLEYDDKLHGYTYSQDVSQFPVFELGAAELAGLFLARQAIESVRGTALEQTMREVFSKLTKMIEGQVHFSWAEADRAFSRKVRGVARTDLKLFGKLAEALLERREVRFSYRKLGAAISETRRLHPYHLGEVERCWYVIGHDLDRDALRTFALPRISRLKKGLVGYEIPEDFDGVAYLGRSFGVWTDPERPDHKQEVRIELTGYAAGLAQERRWHPSQQVKLLNAKGTRVEVCFEVGRLEELLRWVLSWGGKARVLAPSELKKMVRDEVKSMG